MGLLSGMNQAGELVQYGSRGDVCILTARALAAEERIDVQAASRKLAGKLEGKPVVKIRHSGADIVISMDMIHKIAKENPEAVVEEDDEV